MILHGSGSTGLELRFFLERVPLRELNYDTFYQAALRMGLQIFTPTALKRPYSPSMSSLMNVWFDRTENFLSRGTNDSHEDLDGIDQSLQQVIDVILSQEQEFDNIFIGGHSMGGCLCLHMLRKRLSTKVRGIFTMGSFLVKSSRVFSDPSTAENSLLPVYMMHGVNDPLIRLSWGEETAANLVLCEVDVTFKSYAGADHGIADDMLVDLLAWVKDMILVAESRGQMDPGHHQRLPTADMELLVQPKTMPYTLHRVTDSADKFHLTFAVPVEMKTMLASRPILACGSTFEFEPVAEGLHTVISSSDPSKTALEIGKRLQNRVTSNGGSLNACPMS